MTPFWVFVGVFWGVWGILSLTFPDRINQRLKTTQALKGRRERFLLGLSRYAGSARYARWMGRAGLTEHGLHSRWAGIAVIGSFFALGFGLFVGMDPVTAMPLRLLRAGLLTVFLGTLIAVLFLRRCIAHHQSRLVRALPGFLAIVALCLESGLGLHAALERASRRDRPHLKVLQVRVRRVLRGLSAGEAFPQAMQRGLEGIDPGPVRQFFEGLIHVDRLGGSLLSAVRGDMEALAEARRHEARERASSAGVALMVPLILLELPALLVLLLGPVMLPFVESFERLL